MIETSLRQPVSVRAQRWLPLVRPFVFILILASTAFFLYALILLFQVGSPSLEDIRPDPTWQDAELLAAMEELGLSAPAAYILVGIPLALASISMVAVGLVIFFRKQRDWFGLYVGSMFVLVGALGIPNLQPVFDKWPTIEPAIVLGGQLTWVAFTPLMSLFPDGRFVPGWTKWALLAWALAQAPIFLLPDIAPFIHLLYILIGIGSQVYRYFRVSRALERQQTRWVFLSFGLISLSIVWILLTIIVSGTTIVHNSHTLVLMLSQAYLMNLGLASLPITIAIAVLRYRLWDLAVVINRALIYGPLMTILAAVFAASIALTTELSKQFFPDSPGVPAVLSAVIVASVFQPLRTRVESWVNKRFFVKKRDLIDGLVEIQPSFWPFRSADEVMQASTQHLCQIMGCKVAAMYLPLDGQRFQAVQVHGGFAEDLPIFSLSPEQRKILEHKRVVESSPGDQLKGYVPLFVEKPDAVQLVGLMGIGPLGDGRGYSGDDLKSLVKLGGHIGLALHALRPSVLEFSAPKPGVLPEQMPHPETAGLSGGSS